MTRKRKFTVEEFVVATARPRTGVIAVASFCAGALLMGCWFFFFAPPKPLPGTAGAPEVARMPPAQAAVALGNWEYDHANWPAAVQHYERAIAAGLDTPDVRTDLGTAYRNLGDGDRALAQYGIAQRTDPFHKNSLFGQALVHADLRHDRPRAIAAAREYLRRFPQGRGVEAARALVARLEGGDGDLEKRLGEFLGKPEPAR